MNKKNFYIPVFSLVLLGSGWMCGMAWEYFSHDETADVPGTISRENQRAPKFIKKLISHSNNSAQPLRFTHKDLEKLITRLKGTLDTPQLEKELNTLLTYKFDPLNDDHLMAVSMLLFYWGQHDPAHAMGIIRDLPPGYSLSRIYFFKYALDAWTDRNLPEALAYYSDPRNNLFVYQSELLPVLSVKLTRKSPDDAWNWLSRLSNKEQEHALPDFFQTIAKISPERIEEFIHKMALPSQWRDFPQGMDASNIAGIVSLWAKVDFEAASKWSQSLPDNWKNKIQPSLTAEKAKTDPEAAIQMISTQSKQVQKESVEKIVRPLFLSANGYEQALSWVKEVEKINPDIELAPHYRMYETDPVVTKQRIDTLPEGKFKDALINRYVIYNLNPNYNEILDMIQKIGNPALRKSTLAIAQKNAGIKTPPNHDRS